MQRVDTDVGRCMPRMTMTPRISHPVPPSRRQPHRHVGFPTCLLLLMTSLVHTVLGSPPALSSPPATPVLHARAGDPAYSCVVYMWFTRAGSRTAGIQFVQNYDPWDDAGECEWGSSVVIQVVWFAFPLIRGDGVRWIYFNLGRGTPTRHDRAAHRSPLRASLDLSRYRRLWCQHVVLRRPCFDEVALWGPIRRAQNSQ